MLAGWKPLHNDHAISEMVLILELDRTPTEAEFIKFFEAKDSLSGLSDASFVRGFQVPSPSQFHLPSQEAKILELGFNRYRPDLMVAERLALSGRMIVYVTSEYSRWSDVLPRATSLIEKALASLDEPTVSLLTVRYVDVFQGVTEDGVPPSAGSILRGENPVIVPGALRSAGNFHSHCGYFTDMPSGLQALTNCDIDFSGSGDERTLSIMTSIRLAVGQPTAPESSVSLLHKRADEAHIACISLLSDLLTGEISARIGLSP